MKSSAERLRILAIDPTSKGFGFVVLEEPAFLVDWGTAFVPPAKKDEALLRVDRLIERYRPDLLVLEACRRKGSRRCGRVARLAKGLSRLAKSRDIAVRSYTRFEIRGVFEKCCPGTKGTIASTLAARFPELVPRLPPVRKPWMSEDERMAIFDATSLAVTYLHKEHGRQAA